MNFYVWDMKCLTLRAPAEAKPVFKTSMKESGSGLAFDDQMRRGLQSHPGNRMSIECFRNIDSGRFGIAESSDFVDPMFQEIGKSS